MGQVEDELAFLLRSENRTAFLAALDEAGNLDRYELEDRLDVSRRTVTRIAKNLTEKGYIEESSNSYTLTAFGTAIAEAYRQCRERTRIATTFRPFLANVDCNSFDMDLRLLRDADITVATEVSPYAPLDRLLTLRETATSVRFVSPIIEKRSTGQLEGRIRRDDEFHFVAILLADVYEAAISQPEYTSSVEILRNSDSVEHFVHPGPMPYFLGIVDDVAVLGASVDGNPHALVESDRPELREWVTDRIDEYHHEAVPADEY